jgi:predicted nucleic acid-binding protein
MKGHPEIKVALQEAEEIILTPVILGELLAGFMRGKWRTKNENELRTFLASPRAKVLNMDEGTSERYAIILDALWKAGNPIPTNDLWIAATAMQHGLRILTTDSHYQKIPQVLVSFLK